MRLNFLSVDIPGQPRRPRTGGPGAPTTSATRDLFNHTRAVDAPVYSAMIGAAPRTPSKDTLVATATGLDIFQPATVFDAGANPQPVLIGQKTKDNLGNTLKLSGSFAQQIAFNDDGTLAYIAGRNSKIYVFDTMTQDIVATYTVLGAAAPITSLILNDGWLYVAQGSNYGEGGGLVRVNVDSSSPDFLKRQQSLTLPAGITSPYGFRDMAINKGRYLAITAPTGRIPITNYPAPAPGNVYVIDLYGVTTSTSVDASAVATLSMASYPRPGLGKGPLYITSGDQRGQFLVSNAKDYNNGAAGITFATDPVTGNLQGGSAVVVDPRLTPALTVPEWLQRKHQQNIQRAADTVIVEYLGNTYALVADYNFLFNDSHFVDYENYGLGKQIGGKIGVIQDPFGKNGAPIYLGATTAIPGAALNLLSLDQSGMLYASAFVEDTSGHYTNGVYSDLMYSSMFVWNASQLIQAGLDAKLAGRKLSIPIDRLFTTGDQLPAVTPARYDAIDNATPGTGPKLNGWIYGIGTYAATRSTPTINLQNVPFLRQLAPSVYTEARAAAVRANVPVSQQPSLVDRGNPTLETFAVRTLAQAVSLFSQVGASVEALFGGDNSAMLARMNDAQNILRYTGYDTSGDGFGAHFASAAHAVDGIVGGIANLGTNFVGVIARDAALFEGLYTGVTPVVPSPTEFLELLSSGASASDTINYIALAVLKYNPITLTAETLYHMSEAAIKGDWQELRNKSYELMVLAGTMRTGNEFPELKRALALKTKEVAFLKQKLRRGVIEETPLRDLVYEAPNVKQYVVESARRDAAGVTVSEGRVLTSETFAKACDGLLEFNERGEVVYKVCFAPGTLVHTNKGLVPIQNIRVGMQVLAQPERGGPRAWRPVVNTVAHLDQQVYAVQVNVPGAQVLTTLITTANHPFWVQGHDWVAAESLEPGHVLQLQDGSSAIVHGAGLVRRTQHAHIGFAADDRVGLGLVLDLSDSQIQPASDALALRLPELSLGEPYLSPVYNFEVDEFHTYYVGEVGVWVHNANCPESTTNAQTALRESITRSEAEARLREQADPCFAAGTLVHTKEGLKPIEDIKVGDLVLSYPDDMVPPRRAFAPFRLESEYYYKPVTQTFVHEDAEVLEMRYSQPGHGKWHLRVTPNHPFYADDRGWVKAKDLVGLDRFQTASFANMLFIWNKPVAKRERVYNIEVADFHTYFVGEAGAWVHNKGNTPVLTSGAVDLATATTTTRLAEFTYKNETPGRRSDTGNIGERIAEDAMEAYNRIEFSQEGRNASNQGADLIGFKPADSANGVRGEVWFPEVKGSVLGKYPSVQYVGPASNAIRWIAEGKDGTLNGQRISAQAQALYARAYDLLTNHNYTLVTGVVEVRVPRGGQTGRVTVDYTPNPNGYLSVESLGEGAISLLSDEASWSQLYATARLHWQNAGASEAALAEVQISVGSLPTRVAAQTLGNQITLSADGAGWGWFVDGTPAEQSEFDATGSATVFQAAAASEAANKLDLLSVLVHELGHVLGLNHTPGAADSLSATITPGQRRLPDAADIAALQATLGAAGTHSITTHTGASAAPSTLTLAAPPAGWVAGQSTEGYGQLWAAMTAINPTLANGSFATGSAGNALQWESVGNVQAGSAITGSNTSSTNSITLGESTSAQAHVGQAFVLSAQDRFLTFTVSGLNLQSNSTTLEAAPQDAFEVALQNANTGANLFAAGTSNLGTSRSDALLNVQLASSSTGATLQDRAVSGLLHTDNPNGSRTYVLDLSGITAGTAVNLSFDLIGFGLSASQLGSKVNISDVRLISTPLAVADTTTLAEDGSTTITVQANDLNASAVGFAPRLVANAQHGQVSISPPGGVFGGFIYTPDANYFGLDTFTYQYSNADGTELSNTVTVSISVAAVNDAPVAADVTVTTDEDTAATINLVAADADNTGAELVFSIQNQPQYGSLVSNPDGSYSYQPAANYFGSDSFTYTVTDGSLVSNVATVSITVTAVNDAPTVPGQTLVVAEDTPLVVNLLAGAQDAEASPLAARIIAGPLHGSLVTNPDGSTSYQGSPDYFGTDSFTYVVNDGQLDSTVATVSFTVTAVNDAPVAYDVPVTTAEDNAVTINLVATDVDTAGATLVFAIQNQPTHGSLVQNPDGSYTYTYTPADNYHGADSFTYTVSDGDLVSNVAMVNITVTSVNDAPTLPSRSLSLDEDAALVIDPLADAIDVDGDVLTAQIVAGPLHGELTVKPDGTYSYTPAANYFGTDSFTYKVSDGSASSEVATVSFTIAAVNDAPVASDITVTTAEDSAVTINLEAADADNTDAELVFDLLTQPAHGSLVRNLDGSYSYSPVANYNGADSFTYTVTDGSLTSNTATVRINVTAVNDAPTVPSRSLSLDEDAALVIDPVNLLLGAPLV